MSDNIDKLLANIDIVAVISRFLNIKQAGANYVALCPFHQDNKPSLNINSSKQIYKCFVCGHGGDAINFLMEYKKIDFKTSINELAQTYHLEHLINTYSQNKIKHSVKQQNLEIYQALKNAQQFYVEQLEINELAKKYLIARGLKVETIKKFGLGFANEILNIPDKSEYQQKAGLLNAKNSKLLIKFRNRIMFPIKDIKSQIVGFGGRAINQQTIPKYLNSPATEVFNKSEILYALNYVINHKFFQDYILVVEGYMDVISLSNYNINNVVASMGTALTEKQIKLLFNHTNLVIICFDGDNAGESAAKKAVNNIAKFMNTNKTIKILILPEGEDPDSLIKTNGNSYFLNLIKNKTISFTDYVFYYYTKSINDKSSLEDKLNYAYSVETIINQMPNSKLKTMMQQQLNKLIGLQNIGFNNQAIVKQKSIKESSKIINLILSALINYPDFIKYLINFDLSLLPKNNKEKLELITELIKICSKEDKENLTTYYIMGKFLINPQKLKLISKLTIKAEQEKLTKKIFVRDLLISSLKNLANNHAMKEVKKKLANFKTKKFSDLTQEEKLNYQALLNKQKD